MYTKFEIEFLNVQITYFIIYRAHEFNFLNICVYNSDKLIFNWIEIY